MGRDVPNIYVGNTVKKRDRLAFKEFVTEVITDTFISQFTPTSSSLDGELFTVFLGPVNNSPTGSGDIDVTDNEFSASVRIQDEADIEGYRFLSDQLQVDNVKDYVDIYLFGVRQPKSKYDIELYTYNIEDLSEEPTLVETSTTGAENEIRFIFNESITRVPSKVEESDWDIRGKIKEIR